MDRTEQERIAPQELKNEVVDHLMEAYLRNSTASDLDNLLSMRRVSRNWDATVRTHFEGKHFKGLGEVHRKVTNIADVIFERSSSDSLQMIAAQNGPLARFLSQTNVAKIQKMILREENRHAQSAALLAYAPHMGQLDRADRHNLLALAIDLYEEAALARDNQDLKVSITAAAALHVAHEYLDESHSQRIASASKKNQLCAIALDDGYYQGRSEIGFAVGEIGEMHHPHRPKSTAKAVLETLKWQEQALKELEDETAGAPEPVHHIREKIAADFDFVMRIAQHDLADPLHKDDLNAVSISAKHLASGIYKAATAEAVRFGDESFGDYPLAVRARQASFIARQLEEGAQREITADILAEEDKACQAAALADLAPGLEHLEAGPRQLLFERATSLFAEEPHIQDGLSDGALRAVEVPYEQAAAALQINFRYLTGPQKEALARTVTASEYHRERWQTAFWGKTRSVAFDATGQEGVIKHPCQPSRARLGDEIEKLYRNVVLNDGEGPVTADATDRQRVAVAVDQLAGSFHFQLLREMTERRDRGVDFFERNSRSELLARPATRDRGMCR